MKQDIPIDQLIENELANTIYKCEDEQLTQLKRSILYFGVLEPLIVSPRVGETLFDIISGNRRKRASKLAGLVVVPCLIVDKSEITEGLVMAHQDQRIKKRTQILREIKVLYGKFGDVLKQRRTTNSELAKEARKIKEEIEHSIGGKHVLQRLRTYDRLAIQIAGEDKDGYNKRISLLDTDRGLTGLISKLERELAFIENEKLVGNLDKVEVGDAVVYKKTSAKMDEVGDGSVQVVVCSPPFLGKRDYKTGESELGTESSVKEFVSRLVRHFSEVKRVLKSNGTLWVNIADFAKHYEYDLVTERFVIAMKEDGWMVHDKLIWVKKNPVVNFSNRAVSCHEHIYVFKLNDFVVYNTEWVNEHKEEGVVYFIGNSEKVKFMRSVFDFRNKIHESAVANNADLKRECKKIGLTLTHSATYPLSLPSVAILSGSRPGDLIVDGFSGTATTGQAALSLNRRFIGYELNPEFLKVGEVRMKSKVQKDLQIQAA
jgi:ParB/RepB/Spo0J family partition protein